MPARLGELVRPYLLRERGISFTSGIGAVMVERFFDLSGLLLLLGLVLWRTPEVPAIYSLVGKILLATLAASYVFILLLLTNRTKADLLMEKVVSIFPGRISHFLEGILKRLIDGFGIMADFKQVLILFLSSVVLWISFAFMTYLFLLAFSVKAPFLVALTIQVFICFGVALPSAPGFIGTFHAACRYALTLFGINVIVAVSFATVYHLFNLVMCLVLGLFSYTTCNYRLDGKMLLRQPEELADDNSADVEFAHTKSVSSSSEA
jgi:glycosyltransferase 2 family protein